jgi:hypothetical protein
MSALAHPAFGASVIRQIPYSFVCNNEKCRGPAKKSERQFCCPNGAESKGESMSDGADAPQRPLLVVTEGVKLC